MPKTCITELDKDHIEIITEALQFDELTIFALLAYYFAYRSWGEEPNTAYSLLIRDIQQAVKPKVKQFRWPPTSKE